VISSSDRKIASYAMSLALASRVDDRRLCKLRVAESTVRKAHIHVESAQRHLVACVQDP
jgi:hypothetical protein